MADGVEKDHFKVLVFGGGCKLKSSPPPFPQQAFPISPASPSTIPIPPDAHLGHTVSDRSTLLLSPFCIPSRSCLNNGRLPQQFRGGLCTRVHSDDLSLGEPRLPPYFRRPFSPGDSSPGRSRILRLRPRHDQSARSGRRRQAGAVDSLGWKIASYDADNLDKEWPGHRRPLRPRIPRQSHRVGGGLHHRFPALAGEDCSNGDGKPPPHRPHYAAAAAGPGEGVPLRHHLGRVVPRDRARRHKLRAVAETRLERLVEYHLRGVGTGHAESHRELDCGRWVSHRPSEGDSGHGGGGRG